MRAIVLRLIATALGGTLLAGPVAAQSDEQRRRAEQILIRAVLERGAFLACARLDQNNQTADTLIRGWQADISDSATLLRIMGYSDDEVRALADRFDVEKAAPKFADLTSLGAYCEVLGDWRTRWTRLQIVLPQTELRRLLKP
jgi:hypothetical protein